MGQDHRREKGKELSGQVMLLGRRRELRGRDRQ